MGKPSFNEFDLTGKVAVVTGAGRGIGYHIALTLARYGADTVVCSRTVSELEEVAAEIEKEGRRCLIQPLDMTNIQEFQPMVGNVMETFGHIDILVNNAGVNRQQWAKEVTEENWDLIMNTNLKGLFFISQAVGKIMIKQKKGKIINISSDAGKVGLPRRAAYCASKGGVNLVTKNLAIEWAKYNINVNAIAPAFIETPLTAPMFEEPGFRSWVLDNTPLRRVGKPGEVAGAVVFLASEVANYVTGHVMLIDGGWTAR
jgi:NAD(P)-dependent dehydrogenase (short-subunit alcohol dehydrogenase family)